MSLTETNSRKFHQLQDVCMERYSNREQKILTTLNFCITALEKLEGWAVFAIFPTDELDGDKYLLFVEERFACVSAQLNNFKNIYNARQDGFKIKKQLEKNYANGFEETDKNGNVSEAISLSLKEKVSEISQRYLREGYHIKANIIEKLQQCRQQLNTLFQWCFTTVRDLESILDEPMIDELYFLVKSKASRTLSTIQIYEEAAEEIKNNMSESSRTQSRSRSALSNSEPSCNSAKEKKKSPLNELDLTKSLPANAIKAMKRLPKIKGFTNSIFLEKSNMNTLPNSSDSTTCSNSEAINLSPESESLFPSSESTPEPPFSPRPENLIHHPKINKDQQLKNNLKNTSNM